MIKLLQFPTSRFFLAGALFAGAAALAGCATGGKFESFDDNDDGMVSEEEADGEIYFFDSYDKNKSGGLEAEEFRWAYAASERRRDKKAGTGPTDVQNRNSGGILGGGGGGGGFGR